MQIGLLPGFEPDSKLRMLKALVDDVEIILAINANDIERDKVRGDLGITYDEDLLRLVDIFRDMGFFVGSVCITRYTGQPNAAAFRARLSTLGIKCYVHGPIAGYPHAIDHIVSDEGYGTNDYIETQRPLSSSPPPVPAAARWRPASPSSTTSIAAAWKRDTPSSRPSPSGTSRSTIP